MSKAAEIQRRNRERDAARGVAQVNLRIPAHRRGEIQAIAREWLKDYLSAQQTEVG